MAEIQIRNFSIIAHIDHGKTTLTDRLLLETATIDERVFRERMMDSNPIEQERGITIKLAPVRMEYTHPTLGTCIYNLIDTPGHVDFTYEVSRSLAAGEGAILLVDATQGVQAQTLSNYYKAEDLGLTIIPVLNKVDLPGVEIEQAILELMDIFGFEEEEILQVSAKTGLGIPKLLETIGNRIPEPSDMADAPTRALVFSSLYDQHKGVVALVRVVDGYISKKEKLQFLQTQVAFEPQELGVFSPSMNPVSRLTTGSVGYVATGLKDLSLVHVGDTLATADTAESPMALPGYKQPQLMVYMDVYPIDGDDYAALVDAMEKLALHDAALAYSATHSPALGNGLRVGFLGVLHAEIVQERLAREYDMALIATAPSVRYMVQLTNGTEIEIHTPAELPDPSEILRISEPIARVHIFAPRQYLGGMFTLCNQHRGIQEQVEYFGDRVQLVYLIPLPELIISFHDELKSVSSGYASMEYEVVDYAAVDAVKLSILVNKEPVDALSQIVVRTQATEVGKHIVAKLKTVIPRALFEIPIQAAIGGKVIARETIKAYRKDVTAKLYGGDRTRRMKLLEKQKKGKERRKQFGSVEIPQEAFMQVLRRD